METNNGSAKGNDQMETLSDERIAQKRTLLQELAGCAKEHKEQLLKYLEEE